ncbi:MAG: YggS family pyridoxal phosphate-dependent enzyme [Sinobacteraceae bacterium]|nr:YggS family pyridoxal phosphate-dependent enzyme [Nevskiaceae bacterium]
MSEQAQGAAAERLHAVLDRMASAARRAGRDPGELTLVAVSKTRPAADLQALIDLGQHHFGENYLQEALPKIDALRPQQLAWHFIGQLQSNKTAPVAEYFDWVHTVDRLKLVQRLAAQRPFHAPPLNVCVQVKLEDEPTKGGATVSELPALLDAVARAPQLHLRGLMTLPPAETAETHQRRWFAALREVFQQMQRQHPAMDTLSMGMSGDLEAAILEGATLIRIGTALFGERLQSQA